jgi:rubrerythrin
MLDVSLFLAHAIQLERDAARRFEDLAHSMQTAGNREVEELFRQLGELSRRHLKSAVARGGFRRLPELSPSEFQWPEGVTPEAAGWQGVGGEIDVLGALRIALDGERSGHAYYQAIANTTTDPEILPLARSFSEEEAQHVAELERWIAYYSVEGAKRPAGVPRR